MNSNELKAEWKRADNYKYNKKKRQAIIDDAISILGIERAMMLCIEEISELIDVIVVNMTDKIDYLHTVEEIADVKFSAQYIKTICNIDDKDIKPYKKKKTNKNRIFAIISSLAHTQQMINKYLRGKKDRHEKIINAYNKLIADIIILEKFFKIKDKDVEKMMNIKIHRTEERIIYNTLD